MRFFVCEEDMRQVWSRKLSGAEKEMFRPFIDELVTAAFKNIAPYFLTGIHVDDKSNGTPVTQADKSTERLLRGLIAERFPMHGIFGEEYGVEEAKGEWPRYRWILDPIDGTRAFISNSYHFGTLIALERQDEEAGEYRPILSAIGFAAAGVRVIGSLDGAELTLESPWLAERTVRPVHVRPCGRLEDATFVTTSHWTTPEQVGDERLQKIIDRVKLYRTWGDCFGYFSVATGGTDLMIDPDLSYWDVAALLPVVEGAGGTLTGVKGGNPLKELSAVCSAGTIHDEVLALLA